MTDSPLDEATDDNTQTDKDTLLSPASERDTEAKQDSPVEDSAGVTEANDADVEVLPGTGGPDDVGDIRIAE